MVEEIQISNSKETTDSDERGFEFVQLDLNDKNLATLFNKDNQELLTKWGISDKNLDIQKFRFNQSFNSLQADDFLKDLFSNKSVQKSFTPAQSVSRCEGVDYKKTNCNVINMEYFDILEQEKLVTKDGAIRQCLEERVDDMALGDKLRQALAWEESEEYELFQDPKYENEFLWRLFKFIVLGGSINQYEDKVTEYLRITKSLYKDLVTVVKDSDTGDLVVKSQVFEIKAIKGGLDLFPSVDHVQNLFFVIVDPVHWHVTLFYHKWTSFW